MDYLRPPPQYNRFRNRTGAGLYVSSHVASGFTPAALGNIGAWWDYSQAGHVTLTGGTKVDHVTDCSAAGGPQMGNNNPGGEGTQSTLNSLGSCTYATSVGIRTPDFTAIVQPFTWWAVLKMTTSGNFIMLQCDTGAGVSMEINGGKFAMNASGTHAQSSVAVDTTTTHLLIAIYNGASSSFIVDGTATTGLTVGSASFGRMWNGWTSGFILGESGYTTGAMSVGDQASMRTYSQAKWGSP